MQSNCFSDLDKVCDGDDRKHVAGYLVYYDPKLVFWSSIKQLAIFRSSIEVEYRALAQTISKVIWIQSLLDKFHNKLVTMPIVLQSSLSRQN